MRNIDNMDEDDGSSPDSSPRREPQFTPNQPHVPVTAPYCQHDCFAITHYQVIDILEKLCLLFFMLATDLISSSVY